MTAKKVTATELARKTNLSRYQIDNILYGRSKSLEVLQKIASALNINFEILLQDSFAIPYNDIIEEDKTSLVKLKNSKEVNPTEYVNAALRLKEVIDEFNVQVSIEQFEEMSTLLYFYKHLAPSSYEERYIAIGLILRYLKKLKEI